MAFKRLSCIALSAMLLLSMSGCRTKNSDSSTRTTFSATTTTSESEESSTEPSETEPTTSESTSESTTEETTSATTTTETTESTTPASIPSDASLEEKLRQLDRVKSVKEVTTPDGMNIQYKAKYSVVFDMPLDWKNPDAGSFPLRTTFIYVDDKASNTFLCNGYNLYDMEIDLPYDNRCDLAFDYTTNQVLAEHRFVGQSVPDGLSIDSLKYWDYLTAENAAEDFHFIISQYKSIFSGKWAFTGASKGGQLTHVQSYLHPEDADVYVSFVAPGGSAQDAPGFFDFIYNEIGDDDYGKDRAKKYRDMVLQLQVEAIKHRDVLAPKYYQQGLSEGCIFSDYVTADILFDMAVLEFATITWQYYPDFSAIEGTLGAKDGPESEYLDLIYQLIYNANHPDVWAHNSEYFAYYVQAAKQNGEHEYDFSFLREALEKDGSGAKLVITEDMEQGLLYRMVFTPEQLEAFTFDDTLYNNMVKWSHETKNTVIMVYGGRDVWYSMRLPDVTDNENIHIFTIPYSSHIASSVFLSPEMLKEYNDILTPILKWE